MPISIAEIDGAYFGTTLPHLLLMTYPELVPAAPAEAFRPRVFGFRVHCPAPDSIEDATSAQSQEGASVRGRSLRSMLAVRQLVERAAKARLEALVDGRVPHVTVQGGALPVNVPGDIDVAGVLAAAATTGEWAGEGRGTAALRLPGEEGGDPGDVAGHARGRGRGRAGDGTGAADNATAAGSGSAEGVATAKVGEGEGGTEAVRI